MVILHLLRPLDTSQLISSEKSTTSCTAFQRRSKQCGLPASGLQSRHGLRFSTRLSSFRADGTISTRGRLLQTVDVDAKVVESQLYGHEPPDVESKAGFPASGTVVTAPMMSRDRLSAPGAADQKASAPSMVMASSEQLNGNRTVPMMSRDPLSAPGAADEKASAPSRVMASSEQLNGNRTAPMMSRDPLSAPGAADQKASAPTRAMASSEQLNENRTPRFSQIPPMGRYVPSKLYGKSRTDAQNQNYDEMGRFKSTAAPPSTEFYSPKSGDLVLAVVTDANDLELTVEIGSRVPAVITMREFQTTIEVGTDSFFKLPPDNDSSETVEGFVVPPVGKILLIGDQAAHSGENVKIGTIFIAEVLNSALGESRPLLTCRRLSEKLVFLRLEQIMKAGEPVKIEITHCNDGGLQGNLEGLRAFIPKSELLARPENTAALQDYIGKTLTVAAVKLEHHLSNIVVSEIKSWMSENVLLGSVHDLLVTKLFPYGLQVEILDTRVRGFIHITNISRGFVMSVYAFFTEGDVIRGMVIKGRKPGQLSFSIEALEPPDEDGLVLKERQRVYDGAEEVVKNSPEYQLPLEERRIFARPLSSTGVILQDKLANLPWLHLEKLKTLP